jgi:hypothetical protein
LAKKEMNLDKARQVKSDLTSAYSEMGKLSSSEIGNLQKKISSSEKLAMSNKEIVNTIKNVNKELENSIRLQSELVVKQETEYEIMQKKLGLSDGQMNIYKSLDKYQMGLNQHHAKTINLFKNMQGMNLSKIFSNPMAAMDKLALGMQNKIINVAKVGVSGSIKGIGVAAAGALKSFALFTAPLLAIQIVVAGLIKMFDVMMKFNFGGIASQFGVAFAKIEHIWKVFEINIINTLKPLEPLFSEIFGGVADIIVTVVELVTEVFGSFFQGFVDSFKDIEGTSSGFMSVFEQIKPIFEEVAKALEPIFNILGQVTGLLIQSLVPIFKIIGAIALPIFKLIGISLKSMTPILEFIIDLLDKYISYLSDVGDIFMWLSDLFMEYLMPIIEKFSSFMEKFNVFNKKKGEKGVIEEEGSTADVAATSGSPNIRTNNNNININNNVRDRDTGIVMAKMQNNQLDQAFNIAAQRGF